MTDNNWLVYLSDPSQTLADSMSEAEWLTCNEIIALQLFVPRLKINDRRVRLFACACCRRIWHLLTDGRSRNAVEVAERYADGSATLEELTQAREKSIEAATAVAGQPAEQMLGCATGVTIEWEGGLLAHGVAQSVSYCISSATGLDYLNEDEVEAWEAAVQEGEKELMVLFRDIVGNPYRLVTVDPRWITPTVLSLAQNVYDDRIMSRGSLDNARLAVLADALEDAGCNNADIMNHLRQPCGHIRGCWAVDLLLGKK